MTLYRRYNDTPKTDAQRNLEGRTHYVDEETLRYHHSRILSTHTTDHGLLFALVESVALDPGNRYRGFRYAIFDLYGGLVDRPGLGDTYRTSGQARRAMWHRLNELDAVQITRDALAREMAYCHEQWHALRTTLNQIEREQVTS